MQFLNALNLSQNELQNVRLQNLASDPGNPVTGQIYYNTSSNEVRFYNGTSWVAVSDAWITDVQATSPIVANVSNGIATISIDAATESSAGSMSASDKTKLNNATDTNTVSTIVMRDASGNFTAGTITADLVGNASTADDADLLDGQEGTYYLDRANHTGTQTASTISDLQTVVTNYSLDEFASPTANVDFGTQRITNLSDPQNDQDAATKSYVDAVQSGLDVKESVRAATTANITLSGEQTIDGVSVVTGDRVLVKEQSTASENGIYIVDSGAWTRATDFDDDAEVTGGAFTFVEEGTSHADSGWVLATDDPITVGTTALSFSQFSGAGQIDAGDGLTKSGSTLNVGGGTGIAVDASSVNIATTYAGQTSITTLGTITSGTWEASTIGISYGGTGATTADAARSNLGATGKFSANVGDGTSTSIVLNHNFSTRDVTILVRENASPYEQVFCNVEMDSTNSVTLKFSEAPSTDAYRAVVVG